MGKIAPSILSADIKQLGNDIKMLDEGGADWIHVDVMDGHFVPNLTFGPNVVSAVKEVTNLPVDVHLMVKEPERILDSYMEAGATHISIHAEATPNIHQIIQRIKSKGIKAGVVINPGTPPQFISTVLSLVDYVLIMTVNPGFGGQEFILETLDKIKFLDQIREDRELKFLIQVDGGINEETIALTHEAGADVFVAGSNIFGAESPQAQIQKLKKVVS